MPSTREDVLNVSWNEENCPQNLDATSFPSGASRSVTLTPPRNCLRAVRRILPSRATRLFKVLAKQSGNDV